MAENWATQEGTRRCVERAAIVPSKMRMFDGLTVAALGAGTYLGAGDDATDRLYEQVLEIAGQGGVNFFDTAINYRGMRSERVLKKALQGVAREEVVIATKGGYLPFEGEAEAFEDYVRIHYLDPGMIEAKEIIAECHCMRPAFLDNQIAKSLDNLGLACIDLYYLHNPEIELTELGEKEFYRRLTAAFLLFEQKVEEKKIGRYGIATWNGFRQKKLGISLTKVLDCAREAGGERHHFKAIQLPLNLIMLEAMSVDNQLEIAHSQQVAVFASAPLMQSQIQHVTSRVFAKLHLEKTAVLQALQFVLSTPFVTAAFVGMKQIKHWEENRSALHIENWSVEDWKRACIALGVKEEAITKFLSSL